MYFIEKETTNEHFLLSKNSYIKFKEDIKDKIRVLGVQMEAGLQRKLEDEKIRQVGEREAK